MSSHRVFEMVDNTTKNVLRVSMNISNRYRLVAVPFKADVYVHLTDTFKNSTVSMPLEGFENMVQDIKDFIPRCRFLADASSRKRSGEDIDKENAPPPKRRRVEHSPLRMKLVREGNRWVRKYDPKVVPTGPSPLEQPLGQTSSPVCGHPLLSLTTATETTAQPLCSTPTQPQQTGSSQLLRQLLATSTPPMMLTEPNYVASTFTNQPLPHSLMMAPKVQTSSSPQPQVYRNIFESITPDNCGINEEFDKWLYDN